MSHHPFELYLLEQASHKSSAKHRFGDTVKEILKTMDDPIIRLQKGLQFLEFNCSLLYGYSSECIDETGKTVLKNVPNVFDSALILSLIMDTGINPNIISNLQSFLTANRNKSGFWTYFLPDNNRDYNILPDDIDDTSSVLMGLLHNNTVSKDEGILIAEKMRQHFLYDLDGLLGTYIKPNSATGKILFEDMLVSARIDVGCCLNCFWLFGHLGLDNILQEEELQPTMKILARTLQEIERDEMVITHGRYYKSPYVLIFFFARFVRASKFGETLFKDLLSDIIMKRLEMNNHNDQGANKLEVRNETVVELACLILAAVSMNMHKEQRFGKAKSLIVLKLIKILALQLPDGSFPRAPIYSWTPYKVVTASKSISTAFAVAAIKAVLDFKIFEV